MLKLIEEHAGLTIFSGLILGFLMPGIDLFPQETVLMVISLVIYLACYNIKGVDFKAISIGSIVYFYVLRYLALPFLTFNCTSYFDRDIAIAVTLLYLMPSGVSTPALSAIYGGNVTLGLVLCLLTHLLTPLIVPFMISQTAGTLITVDTKALFITLLISIVGPVILYFLTNQIKLARDFSTKHNRGKSIILVSSIGFFVVGMQRKLFFEKLPEVPMLLLIATLMFSLLFLYAWLSECKEDKRSRITYTIVSGFNNTGLGVGIALLYFPSETALFLLCTEIPWCIAPMVFSWFLKTRAESPPPL